MGAVWVFARSGSTYTQQGPKLTPTDETPPPPPASGGSYFGTSLALSGDGNTAVIGGSVDYPLGAAWVFTRSGSTFTQQGAKLTPNDAVGQPAFGDAVAISADGSTALIGGPEDNLHVGAAWVFARSGVTFTQQGPKLTPTDELGAGRFGQAVALSSDGNTLLIGGPDDNPQQGNGGNGAMWEFTRSGSTSTQQGPKITPNDGIPSGRFGSRVTLSPDAKTALISGLGGAYNHAGAAWVFAPGSLSVSDVAVAEPVSGSTAADFKVSLDQAASQPVTVRYATQDGSGSDGATATEGDYTPSSGLLTFAPGETEKTVSVAVNHVGAAEAAESFSLALSGEVGAGVSKRVGVGTIASSHRLVGRVVDRKGNGLAGVRVSITGPESRSVVTDSSGGFAADLLGGTYSVAPTGVPPGQPDGGSYEPSNSVDCTAVQQSCRVNLDRDRSVGFAYVFKLPISGSVRDVGGAGIAGVPVRIVGTDADGHAVDVTTSSDSAGSYSQLLVPGSYTVAVRSDGGGGPPGASYVVKDCSGQQQQRSCAVTLDTKPQTADFVSECETKVTFGPVQAISGCFRTDPKDPKSGKLTSDGPVRVNGLDLSGSGKILLDTKASTISSTGRVVIRAGDAVLFNGPLKLKLTPKLELPVSGKGTLKGFPIEGKAKLTLVLGKTTLGLEVKLPKLLGGVLGDASLSTDNASGLKLDTLNIKVGEATLRGFGLKKVSVSFDSAKDEWSGGAQVVLPSAAAAGIEIGGKAAFQKGSLSSASGEIAGINKPLANGVFLQAIRLGFTFKPSLSLSGGMGLSLGPRILGKEAVRADGDMTYEFADPGVWTILGAIQVVDVKLGSGEAKYNTAGKFDFKGNLGFAKGAFKLDSKLTGFVDGGQAFNAEGTGTLKVGAFTASAEALLSDKGLVGCGTFAKHKIGASFRWGAAKPTLLGGACDLGPFRSTRSARTASLSSVQPKFTRTLTVRRGLPLASFAAVGNTAPPKITLTGPHGERVSSPAAGQTLRTGRFLLTESAQENTTYIVVDRPSGGTWKLTANAGSVPVSDVRQADGLPAPSVQAHILGSGEHRKLSWSLKAIAGQRVEFFDQGTDGGRRLIATNSPHGTVAIPAIHGHAQRRTIIALITLRWTGFDGDWVRWDWSVVVDGLDGLSSGMLQHRGSERPTVAFRPLTAVGAA